jgi:hypothetical protein
LWDRWRWTSIAIGFTLAAVADLISIGVGVVPVAYVNYVFVWATVHQLGYAWLDGAVEGVPRRLALMLSGLAGALALVIAGPYPVAMVGVQSGLTNSSPPRLTLALLAMFQAGLVLLAEPRLRRLMRSRGLWTGVVVVSSRTMTLYLWHLTAMILVIAFSLGLDGLGLSIEPTSSVWWLTRPLWVIVLVAMTSLLAIIFGRFERPGPDHRRSPAPWRPLLAVAMVCAGLGGLASSGVADGDGMNGLILTLPIAGIVIGGIAGSSGSIWTDRQPV